LVPFFKTTTTPPPQPPPPPPPPQHPPPPPPPPTPFSHGFSILSKGCSELAQPFTPLETFPPEQNATPSYYGFPLPFFPPWSFFFLSALFFVARPYCDCESCSLRRKERLPFTCQFPFFFPLLTDFFTQRLLSVRTVSFFPGCLFSPLPSFGNLFLFCAAHPSAKSFFHPVEFFFD